MSKSQEIYDRTARLKVDLNSFLQKLTGNSIDYYSSLSQQQLIDLKLTLSDVNNVMTLKTTLSLMKWLIPFLGLSPKEKRKQIDKINTVKPNTNGYDIEINSTQKLIAEVKCIIPINHGTYYGAAQRNSILDDGVKLMRGKKRIKNTRSYIKLIGLIDIGAKTDMAIKKLMTPAKNIRTKDKIRLARHEIVPLLKLITNRNKLNDLSKKYIYIKKIRF